MIAKLKDGTEVSITTVQAENLKKAIANGVVGVEVNGVWFRCDYVATIKSGGEARIEPSHQLSSRASISEEDRQKSLETIEKLRAKILKKL